MDVWGRGEVGGGKGEVPQPWLPLQTPCVDQAALGLELSEPEPSLKCELAEASSLSKEGATGTQACDLA